MRGKPFNNTLLSYLRSNFNKSLSFKDLTFYTKLLSRETIDLFLNCILQLKCFGVFHRKSNVKIAPNYELFFLVCYFGSETQFKLSEGALK